MTMVQEATQIIQKMPKRKQQIVLDLLRMISGEAGLSEAYPEHKAEFKRTGKTRFSLPADFDEHFDDMNEEITAMFSGDQ